MVETMKPSSRLRKSLSTTETSATSRAWEQVPRSKVDDSFEHRSDPRFLAGLTIAGVGLALLTTVFGLFYVDVFLRVYDLPLPTYATGNLIYSFINTANDLAGAWLVDWVAAHSSRSDAIGFSGCLFAIFFLAPFFRWHIDTTDQDRSHFWEGTHFVTTMSLYDTMFSFVTILLGSIVTDNHTMTDRERVRFMASGKVVNMLVTFAVGRIGLAVFTTEDMSKFRVFLVMLSIVVCLMFLVAQYMVTRPGTSFRWKTLGYRRLGSHKSEESWNNKPKKQLQLGRVIRDLNRHHNFRAWIGMQMLLQSQNNFFRSFLKTFMDRLIFDAGVSRDTCDWILSLIRPLEQLAAILLYIPIRQRGYRNVYMFMFAGNLVLSAVCLAFGSPSSTTMIVTFLVIHSVMTGAVLDAGFHLAMSDMVLEMKTKHALEQRFGEPSLAGLFMGANALLCKPMDAFLPIVAAYLLRETDLSEAGLSDRTRWMLFYLLLVPPFVFSSLQIFSWRRYNLNPERTKSMREELAGLYHVQDLP